MSFRPERILVIRFRNLGDLLLATPLLRALRRRYPEARVDYLVEESLAPLLAGSEDFHRLLAWPRRAKPRWFSDLRWALRLRRERYDLILDLHGSSTSVLFTALSGASRRIGYRVRGRHFFYTEKIDRHWEGEDEALYEPARHFRLVKSLGLSPEDLELRLPRPASGPGAEAWGEASGPRILCSPGATWKAKQWPPSHYVQLIRRLHETGARVLLLGSPAEMEVLEAIAAESPALLRKGTSLPEMLSLIASADLLVGTDSGTRHAAVAYGTPSVGIFGPSDPRVWSPSDPMHPVVKLDLDCMPCGLTSCPLPGHPCMNALTPERVFDSIRALLSEGRPS